MHRQVTFGYAEEVAIAIAANAGTYTMPDPHTPFPYGIDGTDAELPSLLSFPLTIMAGTADSNADEPFVRATRVHCAREPTVTSGRIAISPRAKRRRPDLG